MKTSFGAVYMSPVCWDEAFAELKIKKRNLEENILTRRAWYERQIHALSNKILIKNNIIRNIAVADNILWRRIFIFTSFFVLNTVSILARLAGLMLYMDKFNPGWPGGPFGSSEIPPKRASPVWMKSKIIFNKNFWWNRAPRLNGLARQNELM